MGLVYLAGYALDQGESMGEIQSGFADAALATALVYTKFPVPGGEDGVDVSVDVEKFPEIFASDVDTARTRVLAVSQRPLAASRSVSRQRWPPGRPNPPGPSSPPRTTRSTPTSSASATSVRVQDDRAGLLAPGDARRAQDRRRADPRGDSRDHHLTTPSPTRLRHIRIDHDEDRHRPRQYPPGRRGAAVARWVLEQAAREATPTTSWSTWPTSPLPNLDDEPTRRRRPVPARAHEGVGGDGWALRRLRLRDAGVQPRTPAC